MNRGQFLKSGALAGVAVAGAFLLPPTAKPKRQRVRVRSVSSSAGPKNVILIIDDDQNKNITNELPGLIDLLGAVRFKNARVTYPLCAPSRVTLLRGQMCHNHGLEGNGNARGGHQPFRAAGYEDESLPVWAKRAGVKTGYIGKYLNGYNPDMEEGYIPKGWDEWYAHEFYSFHRVNDNGAVKDLDENSTVAFGRRAVSFIDRAAAGGDRFFLTVSPSPPHDPPEVQSRYADRFAGLKAPRTPNFDYKASREPAWLRDRPQLTVSQEAEIDREYRQQAQSMLSVRDLAADIVTALKANGLYNDTYIIFTSDNGYHHGNHRLMPGKLTPFMEDDRVPLFVSGGGLPEGPVTKSELIGNHDWAPTIIDMLGGASLVPEWVDGTSFLPLLAGDIPDPVWRTRMGLEGYGFGPSTPPPWHGVITETQKLILYDTGEAQWFRLDLDPHELDNKPPADNLDTYRLLWGWARDLYTSSGAALKQAEGF